MFNKKSYERHNEWYNLQFPTEQSKVDYLRKSKNVIKNSIGIWLQDIFFSCLDPLLQNTHESWLTIGDAYGFDAHYIQKNGNRATASDLNTDFLEISKKEGIIYDFSTQNAEYLSYENDQFDYLLCKETYHHFPKPYAALYEMIRVARKGIVLIEPQDPITQMPVLLYLSNIFSLFSRKAKNPIWKNRFSYEPVGNFVYKISQREIEKFAAGLNLPVIAFKKINPNFYFKGANEVERTLKDSKYRSIFLRKTIIDFLVRIRIIPSQVLSAIVFKELPNEALTECLEKAGYRLVHIPENPYIREASDRD